MTATATRRAPPVRGNADGDAADRRRGPDPVPAVAYARQPYRRAAAGSAAMSRAPAVDGRPRETTPEGPSVDAELARALDAAHHIIGTSNGGPGWRDIVDTLRRNPDGILSAAAEPGGNSDAVRESVLLTLALVAGPGDDPGIARRLERTAERAARGDIERDRLWSAVATTLRLVWEEVAAAPGSPARAVPAGDRVL